MSSVPGILVIIWYMFWLCLGSVYRCWWSFIPSHEESPEMIVFLCWYQIFGYQTLLQTYITCSITAAPVPLKEFPEEGAERELVRLDLVVNTYESELENNLDWNSGILETNLQRGEFLSAMPVASLIKVRIAQFVMILGTYYSQCCWVYDYDHQVISIDGWWCCFFQQNWGVWVDFFYS